MDIRDLRSRIDIIKKQAGSSGTGDSKKADRVERPDPGKLLIANGWEKLDDMVYKRVSVLKNILPEVISDVVLEADTGSPSPDTAIPSSQFVFYDTETTGLSAGAGNLVFLAGFGFVEPSEGFKIVQLFLSDFPGEPAYLEQLKKYISPERIYVSYNGKSFDANVLKSRFALNGMSADFGYQLDLLYSSRRLWKNIIGSCSLGDIERRVLDKHRPLDVPGFMVPDLYFDFMRSGRYDTIEGVIAHHEEDISSLAELLAVHEQLFSEAGIEQPSGAAKLDYFDPLGLSSLLETKKPDKSAAVLMLAYKNGNNRAGYRLAMHFKRSGLWENAVEIWNELWENVKSINSAIELAKYYEHRERNIEKALEITMGILSLERFRTAHIRSELEKRKNRLESRQTTRRSDYAED